MSENQKNAVIPVWFFVGLILFVYGVIIFITGVAEFNNPPKVHLAELHAPIWWGAFLALFGGTFVSLFRPKKSKAVPQPQSKTASKVVEQEKVTA
jgi:FtsH-binding integral membrane protein